MKDEVRAADIIDHLQSLYKKAPPRRESVDVDEIIGEYHDAGTYAEFLALLEPTHIVTQWTTGNVGTFGAVLRQ